jgi:hypothetical protein
MNDQPLLTVRGEVASEVSPQFKPLRAHQPGAPDEFTFNIAPTKQTVQASVEARFRISAPDLAASGST